MTSDEFWGHWSYWSWPFRGYTPVLAYIFFHRVVARTSWQEAVREGLSMWWVYLKIRPRNWVLTPENMK